MIHSLAGGSLGKTSVNNFAKVKILEGIFKDKWFWYLTEIKGLKAGEIVIVPVGESNLRVKGEVLRIDENVSNFCSPVPVKRAKKIINVYNG